MGLLEAIGQRADDATRATFGILAAELQTGLARYWKTAGKILDDSGIILHPPPPDYLAMEKNIFSTLFLYSYYAADIDPARRVLYVAVNQCLRGMVTGCDNILDDEYKQTLDTDLPSRAVRFRSIVDIMVSDRVLFELLLEMADTVPLTGNMIQEASAASLRALTRSGTQEASEEGGVGDIPAPERVLRDIHHYKTGLLFQCPWAVPGVIETDLAQSVRDLREHLYQIGMGCQLFDDIVDLEADVRGHHYNFAWSKIFHAADGRVRQELLDAFRLPAADQRLSNLHGTFPEIVADVAAEGQRKLEDGLEGLLRKDHRHLKIPLAFFLIRRIGADHFLPRMTAA
jgi:hypothetical protein